MKSLSFPINRERDDAEDAFRHICAHNASPSNGAVTVQISTSAPKEENERFAVAIASFSASIPKSGRINDLRADEHTPPLILCGEREFLLKELSGSCAISIGCHRNGSKHIQIDCIDMNTALNLIDGRGA